HHGNGTQAAFEQDSSVFFASLHQFPLYPGSGRASERGTGAGEGFTLNCPMDPGSGDSEYLAAFEERVLPALDEFAPEFVLVSAGFDAHRNDPLSGTLVSEETYHKMTKALTDVARRHAQGRLVSVLEGGYDLPALALSAEQHLMALIDA
ncbi:MAG: histone deacetylase, partial [Proteobacteria bacterium]|nr:histone deacetylase [Pseudomonadota bacterium]